MPNHIQTQVRIASNKEAVAKLVKDTKLIQDPDVDKNHFDFNGIIQMPPELLKTNSPVKVVETQEEADRLNAEEKERRKGSFVESDNDSYFTQSELDRRLKEYGATDWYDWANRHWGTKWNAYDVRYITGGDDYIVIEITTAWDTPSGIWEALREKGYTVDGVYYGEMDGYEYIGVGIDYFAVDQTIDIEYVGEN